MNVMNQEVNDKFAIYNADCVEIARTLPENSIDFSVFSPPFESLYVYSNIDRDMGNSKDSAEFWQHYKYLIAEEYRIHKPGRLIAIHCMNLPTSKSRDGFIGIRDFRGEIIRAYQDVGFIYHSEVCIWKDPVIAMQRTKALGLLYKQLRKDSAMSRQGIPDYLVIMRKPGENPDPVTKYSDDDQCLDVCEKQNLDYATEETKIFPVSKWQQYASPVWMDINPSKTLQYMQARDNDDERHIAPLQLEVIQRSIELWTNPNDLVYSPFTGIGSEGYVSLKMGRRFVGTELKRSYFDAARRNLLEAMSEQTDLFTTEEK